MTQQFNKGDKVTLKKDLKDGEIYGAVLYQEKSMNFKGAKTVKEVYDPDNDTDKYILNSQHPFVYSGEMLDKAQ